MHAKSGALNVRAGRAGRGEREAQTWCGQKQTRRRQRGNCSCQRQAARTAKRVEVGREREKVGHRKRRAMARKGEVAGTGAGAVTREVMWTGDEERRLKEFCLPARIGKNLSKNAHGRGKNPYVAASTAERGGLGNPQNRDRPQLQ
jgi:hypothetical protein